MIFISMRKDHRNSGKNKNPHMLDFFDGLDGLLHDPHRASLESKSKS